MSNSRITLKDFCVFKEGYVNPSQTCPDYFDGDVKWLRANDLNNSRVYDTSRKLSRKGFESAKKSAILFKPGSLAISKSGTIGRLGILEDFMCGNRAVINIEVNEKKASNMFVFFSLLGIQKEIEELAVGSVRKNLYTSILGDIRIEFPPLPEQQAIAEVLSSLDDKIDLLHRNNKTLEEMAETLFRQWFVEGAKEEWEVGTVNSLVTIRSGFAFKSTSFVSNGRYKLITIKNVQDGYMDLSRVDYLDNIPDKTPDWCKLVEGDILLSLTGNVGRCCLVEGNHLLLNQRVAKLEPKNKRDWAFTYFYFRLSSVRKGLEEISKGTAQANLSPIDTGNMELVIPSENVLISYSAAATPLLHKILANKKQVSELMQMRDTLLPKLMSGQVRVGNN